MEPDIAGNSVLLRLQECEREWERARGTQRALGCRGSPWGEREREEVGSGGGGAAVCLLLARCSLLPRCLLASSVRLCSSWTSCVPAQCARTFPPPSSQTPHSPQHTPLSASSPPPLLPLFIVKSTIVVVFCFFTWIFNNIISNLRFNSKSTSFTTYEVCCCCWFCGILLKQLQWLYTECGYCCEIIDKYRKEKEPVKWVCD